MIYIVKSVQIGENHMTNIYCKSALLAPFKYFDLSQIYILMKCNADIYFIESKCITSLEKKESYSIILYVFSLQRYNVHVVLLLFSLL